MRYLRPIAFGIRQASLWLGFLIMGSGNIIATQSAAAQGPAVELKPQDVNLWEHRLGPETAVHISGEEYQTLRLGPTYVEFEIVVSENGRVEKAEVTGYTKVHVEEAKSIEMDRTFKPWTNNGAKIRVKLHDYVSLLPPEQWADVRVPFPEPWDLRGASVQLRRTGCFGTCPDYQVAISGDGTVSFSGHNFVLIPGDHIAPISSDAVRELIRAFEKADFFSAKDAYTASVTDNPTQTLTLNVAGRTKTVTDYVGTEVGLPLAIRNLEAEVDEVAGTARWVKGDESTTASLENEKWPFASPARQNVELYNTAISKSNKPLADRYLAAGGPIVAPEETLDSPVCVASGMGEMDLVARMMRPARTPPTLKPSEVRLPSAVLGQCLWSAAHSGNVELVEFWLNKGADPKKQPPTTKDWTLRLSLLANGILSSNREMVNKLLDLELDVHAPVMEGEPLLTFALERAGAHATEIVAELVKAGADVNARGRLGETPLFAANSAPDAVKILLAAGADLEARDDNGNTALIRYGFSEAMVRELLADGANPTLANKRGDTPLKIAHQLSCPACASLIEEALKKWVGTNAPLPNSH